LERKTLNPRVSPRQHASLFGRELKSLRSSNWRCVLTAVASGR